MTLIPEAWAVEGQTFIFQGETVQCEACPLRQPCLSLEAGLYRLIKVRPVSHTCPGPFDGPVRVAEVEPTSDLITLGPGPGTLEGATITLRKDTKHFECTLVECGRYQQCHPAWIENTSRVSILKLKGAQECPRQFKLTVAEVVPAS